MDLSENIPQEGRLLTDIFFIDENEGWITSASVNEIYHTTDGGLTFETQTTLQPTNAIYMLNENKGFAAGQSGAVFYTNNGGNNWNLINNFLPSTIRGMSFPPESDTGFVCGDSGWVGKIDSTQIFDMEKLVNSNLYAISFPVNGEGWLCGGSIIRHYVNGVWTADQNYAYGGYNAIHFINTSQGWAGGDDGIIIHTTDGINWTTQLPSGSGYTLHDIFFLDELNGWAVGGNHIPHTNDGGNTWDTDSVLYHPGYVALVSVFFLNEDLGFVSGFKQDSNFVSTPAFFKYTEISGIGDEQHSTYGFEIFPNPARNEINVRSLKFGAESCTIELYDLNGKILLEKQIPARPVRLPKQSGGQAGGPAGTETMKIDISELNSGVYFLRLKTENKSLTKKLIIQK